MSQDMNTIRERIRYLTHPDEKTAQFSDKDITAHRVMAALSALPMFFWLPIVKKSRSPFVLFHASNGLVLLLGCGAAMLVSLITGFFSFGWLISLPLWGFLAVESVFTSIEALSGSARDLHLLFPVRKKAAAWLKKYMQKKS